MASIKLVHMSQDSNNHLSSYLPDPSLRTNAAGMKGGLWSSAPPATPQTSNASMSSVWGSPLSVLPSHSTASTPQMLSSGNNGISQAFRTHSNAGSDSAPQSLAALAADSEPVPSHLPSPAASGNFQHPLSTDSSRFSSRQNSQTDITPPTPLSGGSSAAAPNTTLMASHNSSPGKANGGGSNDEIINTAIVVKNIPFAIKKEQLIDFMTQLGLPLPYAFNYHFDNGVFRGLAFANFTSAEETAVVIPALNGRELGGRKLRVEYKKMLPYQERERIEREKRERRGQLEEQHQQGPANKGSHFQSQSPLQTQSVNAAPQPVIGQQGLPPISTLNVSRPPSSNGSPRTAHSVPLTIDMNDPETLQLYSSLLIFKRDFSQLELIIPPVQVLQLPAAQLETLKALCQRLELNFVGSEERGVVVSRQPDSNLLYKTDADSDAAFYLTGILGNALTTPASPASFARARVSSSGLPPAVNGLGGLGTLNRWNNVA